MHEGNIKVPLASLYHVFHSTCSTMVHLRLPSLLHVLWPTTSHTTTCTIMILFTAPSHQMPLLYHGCYTVTARIYCLSMNMYIKQYTYHLQFSTTRFWPNVWP